MIAVSVESPERARIAARGEIFGDGQRLEISGNAADWKATPRFDREGKLEWYDPSPEFATWPMARSGELLENPVYAPAPPDIWERPMPLISLTGPTSGGELKLGLMIPGAGPAQQKPSWVRVYSNWVYYLFAGDQFVGAGGGAGPAEAWDLTAFQSATPQRLTLRVIRQNDPLAPPDETQPVPLVTLDGDIGGRPISTESGWQRADGLAPDWLQPGGATWTPASRVPLNKPIPSVQFQFPADVGWFWLGKFFILWTGCAALILILYQAQTSIQRVFRVHPRLAHGATVWILSLVFLGLILFEWLQWRFFTTDSLLLFTKPENRLFIQMFAPVVLVAAFAAYVSTAGAAHPRLGAFLRQNLPSILLIAIIVLTIAMRVYQVGLENLQDDENVSWDAARGILRTGLPVETSGIFYTRSMLYHYLLAGWIGAFGDTKSVARAFSIIPGVLAVWFTYRLTLRVLEGARSPLSLQRW